MQQYLKEYIQQFNAGNNPRLSFSRKDSDNPRNGSLNNEKDDNLLDLIMNSTTKQNKNNLKYFHYDQFNKKMAREYLSWVGIFSRYKIGN